MIIGLLLRSIASVATLAWQRGDLLTDIIKAVFSLVLPVASDNLFFSFSSVVSSRVAARISQRHVHYLVHVLFLSQFGN